MAHIESAFRLLVPASDTVPLGTVSIDVAGQRWRVVDYGAVPLSTHAPEYICVSYSWGVKKTSNPFDPERPMSLRTLPVLETAITSLRPPAIWLDAVCMPSQEQARSLCLRNMGAIYAAASSVLTILSPSASILLDKVRRKDAIDSEGLQQFEADDWVSRVWTYQEIVNSKLISFTAEGETGNPVPGHDLLNAVVCAISDYCKTEQVDGSEFRQRYPRLDALESLIADWFMANYSERSAYQIMSAMEGRTPPVYPDDYFYAMIGAITSVPSTDPNDAALSPPEYFMRVCEQKGDFSFLYSSAPRASGNAGSWRPRSGPLLPIVPWFSAGERQTGELHLDSLHLHNMVSVPLGPLEEAARTFIYDWLKAVQSPLPPNIEDAVRAKLYRTGFTGCGEYLETKHGLFFRQYPLVDADNGVVFVAKDISLPFGAPALLLDPAESGMTRLRDVGVFVGPVPETRETIIIG
jgi:hypothetical protein